MNSNFIELFISRFPLEKRQQLIKYAIIVGLHKINNKYDLNNLDLLIPNLKKYTNYAK